MLTHEIITETLTGQPDITVVGEVAEDVEILSRVDETNPAVYAVSRLLQPELNLIAVSAHTKLGARSRAFLQIYSDVMES